MTQRTTRRPATRRQDGADAAPARNLPQAALRQKGSARPAAAAGPALVTVDGPAILVEAVKLADDRSGDVIVRLYESRGGRARGRLRTGFPLASAEVTDLLEVPLAPADAGALALRPFQILTLRLRPAAAPAGIRR